MTQPLALISVTDKTGLDVFAQSLVRNGYKILSTGGTAKALKDSGIEVTEISEWTGLRSIMDGRVKTLHPKIYTGILCDHDNPKHREDMHTIGSEHIALVCVNLYDFAGSGVGLDLEKAIEYIDIGGPTLLRASAKNYKNCLSVIDPKDYAQVVSFIEDRKTQPALPQKLATKVFARISSYDAEIASYFESILSGLSGSTKSTKPSETSEFGDPKQSSTHDHLLPATMSLAVEKVMDLRYGENPHQQAAFYKSAKDDFAGNGSLADLEILQGKPLSYNNLLDLNSAIELVRDLLPYQACAIVKHNNPCGVGCSVESPSALPSRNSALSLFKRALACDPTSAFGGIIALNLGVTAELASYIAENMFIECLVAPDFDAQALDIFAKKKNIRLLKSGVLLKKTAASPVWTQVRGGFLVQGSDSVKVSVKEWQCKTKLKPTDTQQVDLEIANTIAKHVKSNALVFVKDKATVAIGAGQMSRIDAARIAIFKNQQSRSEDTMQLSLQGLEGSAMASDAFFPFSDVVESVAKEGVTSIIQPGGSIRDGDSIEACDKVAVAMVHTGMRHFRH